jgi:hypothetical protein
VILDMGAADLSDFEIVPFAGLGDVKFGMSPQEVRHLMGTSFKSFKRTPQATFPADVYATVGLFFYYDSAGALEAIEFAAPANPTVNGIELLGRELAELVSELSSLGEHIEADADSAIANGMGVSVRAPLAKDAGRAHVDSALAFRRGYYD